MSSWADLRRPLLTASSSSNSVCRTDYHYDQWPITGPAKSVFWCGNTGEEDVTLYSSILSLSTIGKPACTVALTRLTFTATEVLTHQIILPAATSTVASGTTSATVLGESTDVSAPVTSPTVAGASQASETASGTTVAAGGTESSSRAWIAGAVVGPIVALASLAGLVWCIVRKRARHTGEAGEAGGMEKSGTLVNGHSHEPVMSPTMLSYGAANGRTTRVS